ncbi:MAG: helix-hairpin-helix domain-containing protein, partial [Chloroflexota bacterium]
MRLTWSWGTLLVAARPPVQINVCSAVELARLGGISLELAERIVSYRQALGYFHGPRDLLQVEGVNHTLASRLAPHVDWRAPEVETRFFGKNLVSGKEREDVSLPLLMLLTVLWVVVWRSWPALQDALRMYRPGDPVSASRLWISVGQLVMAAAGGLALVAWMGQGLCRSRRWGRWWQGWGLFLLGVAVVALLATAVGNAGYYTLYAPGGWGELLHNRPALWLLATVAVAFSLVGGVVAGVWRPSILTGPVLGDAADAVVLVGAVILAGLAWFHPELTETRFLGKNLVWAGGLLMVMGVMALHSGRTFFRHYLAYFNLT